MQTAVELGFIYELFETLGQASLVVWFLFLVFDEK